MKVLRQAIRYEVIENKLRISFDLDNPIERSLALSLARGIGISLTRTKQSPNANLYHIEVALWPDLHLEYVNFIAESKNYAKIKRGSPGRASNRSGTKKVKAADDIRRVGKKARVHKVLRDKNRPRSNQG